METEIELIVNLHKGTQRQGPGSEKETLLALDMMDIPLSQHLKVVDIGCGSGGQTITLARNLKAHLTAVDIFPVFLNALEEEAQHLGLENQISTLQKSMDDLPFDTETFDIIWSEGAIYNMGFENGIQQWRPFLKAGGYLAVTEITWITDTRPAEIERYWNNAYPQIDVASNKIKILEENGFSLVGYFYLSEDSWLENYYKPLMVKFDSFLKAHNDSLQAKKLIEAYKREITMYQKYKAYYSYGFYIGRKN